MTELSMLFEAIRNIPEMKPARPIVMGYADNYGPGRHAEAKYSPETSGYDYLYAEMCNERNAEKEKVRNRRRNNRKHPENKEERMRKMHNRMERKYGYYSCDGGFVYRGFVNGEIYADGKVRVKEQIARNDWALESAEIAEAEEWERINAELDEFNRKWREEADAEQRRMREYRKMCELNDWLKYA